MPGESPQLPVPLLDYASSSLKSPLYYSRRLAIIVLAVGTLLYSLACIGSFSRTPWPPIDRIWEAPPWLWVFAIPVFTLVTPGGKLPRKLLVLYALVTGGIDAWTFPFFSMNPHRSFDWDLWSSNLPPVITLHLVLTIIIALLSRLTFLLLRVSPTVETIPQPQTYRRARIVLFAMIATLAAIFPFGYRIVAMNLDAQDGARMADTDWNGHNAGIYADGFRTEYLPGDYYFTDPFDADTGLQLKQKWQWHCEPGYNAEIHRLIQTQGIPAWSLKSRFVDDADMINMLTATDMKLITTYPCILSPNLCIFRGGGTTPWGTRIIDNSNDLDIQARNRKDPLPDQWGAHNEPAYISQLPRYPGTFFIRCGNSVTACTADGWIIKSMSHGR